MVIFELRVVCGFVPRHARNLEGNLVGDTEMKNKAETVKTNVKPASGNAIRELSAAERHSVAGGSPWPPKYVRREPTPPF